MSFVNHRCNISLPCVRTRALRAGPVRQWSETALVTARADDVGVPAGDRTGGCRPAHTARDAEHGADQHRLAPRLGGVDERLGPAWIEEATVIAEAPLLCVEVADSIVARGAARQVRVESTRLRRLRRHAIGRWLRGRGASSLVAAVSWAGVASARSGYWRRWEASPWRVSGASELCPGASVHSVAAGRAGSAAGTHAKARRTAIHPSHVAPLGDFGSILRFGNKPPQPRCGSGRRPRLLQCRVCGCSSMVEPQPSKLITRVRFPPPASNRNASRHPESRKTEVPSPGPPRFPILA